MRQFIYLMMIVAYMLRHKKAALLGVACGLDIKGELGAS